MSEENIELEIQSTEQDKNINVTTGMVDYESKNNQTNIQTSNSEIDKQSLWKILQKTQCPLMPYKYESDHKLETAYYFNDEFWTKDESSDIDTCRQVHFQNDKDGKKKRKAKDDAELMIAVDKYTNDVRINKSYEIFDKLCTALKEASGEDDGDASNDAYQKLMPTMMGRIMFLSVFLTTGLNGYFLCVSLWAATEEKYNTKFMNMAALIMGICEVVLFANIVLGSVISYAFSLVWALCTSNSTYIQSKRIAENLRELSTLSILRYMPSIEIVSSAIIHWKETISKIFTDFFLLCSQTFTMGARSNPCELIFRIPIFIIETFAPILALYAILVKIKQLEFVVQGEPFQDWELAQYISFFAFLNQVAGLRVLRNVETQSIQHFVFSGSDASLDTDELLLLDDWWNVTVLSAVSNLHLHWYDNMVFWYSLDPQKIQLLLKSHDSTLNNEMTLREMIKENDNILTDYDQMVSKELNKVGGDSGRAGNY